MSPWFSASLSIALPNLGNFKKRLTYAGIQGITVTNYLYILQSQKITKVDIYSSNKNTQEIILDNVSLLSPKKNSYIFLTASHLFLITPSFFLIYSKV